MPVAEADSRSPDWDCIHSQAERFLMKGGSPAGFLRFQFFGQLLDVLRRRFLRVIDDLDGGKGASVADREEADRFGVAAVFDPAGNGQRLSVERGEVFMELCQFGTFHEIFSDLSIVLSALKENMNCILL